MLSITMIKLLSLSVFLICLPFFSINTQQKGYSDTARENAKSIWFEKDGWRLAYPVIMMSKNEQVTLHFDILYSRYGSLNYKVVHCDREWQKSDLFTSDYIEGFEENQISNYEASFNTTVSYTHYRLTLPNDDISFKLSGNYVIIIYPDGEEDTPVITRRLYVTEGKTSASVVFRRPMTPGLAMTHQQSEISVNTGSLDVNDPYHDITISILQNGRQDKARFNLLPDFVADGKIEFNTLSDKTLFPGGNEFRFFDIKTIRQKRQNIRDIVFLNGQYHVYLLPSENREFKQYFFNEDFNGKYFIAMEESDEPDRDADYVWVYFTLTSNYELEGGSVFIAGAFTDWQARPENKMTYNASKGWYELTLLLKQGWYNYEYVFLPDGSDYPEGFHFEGSHYETTNDYLILTYFRDRGQRYDRLTDASVANSLNGR